MRAIDFPVPHADKIKWKSDSPVWVDQWPLTQEKLRAANKLVQEQLAAGHLEHTTSPWNTPIFVIFKKIKSMETPPRPQRNQQNHVLNGSPSTRSPLSNSHPS